MKKTDLVNKIAEKHNVPTSEAAEWIKVIFSELGKAMADGTGVEIRGFGTFRSKIRSPRPYKARKAGNVIHVSERLTPFFRPGKELRNMVDKPLNRK